MEFEWDEEKANATLHDRGIDFNYIVRLFDNPRLEKRSDRNGEERWLTIGEVDRKVFAVVFTRRGHVIRIISARRARRDEERSYRSHYS
jgi:uncharacterized protein